MRQHLKLCNLQQLHLHFSNVHCPSVCCWNIEEAYFILMKKISCWYKAIGGGESREEAYTQRGEGEKQIKMERVSRSQGVNTNREIERREHLRQWYTSTVLMQCKLAVCAATVRGPGDENDKLCGWLKLLWHKGFCLLFWTVFCCQPTMFMG